MVKRFENLMIRSVFKVNENDKCINYRAYNDICMIICVYVDDLLIYGSKIPALNALKSLFSNNFN